MRTRLALGILVAAFASVQNSRADDRVASCIDNAEKAQELRDSAKLVEARLALVACAQRECPEAVRDACTEWLADVERRIPSIVLAAKDIDGADVPSARATLDGLHLPNSVATTAVRADPGTHLLRCEAPGYVPVDERVTLREGDRVRVVSIVLRREGDDKPRRLPLPPKRVPLMTYVLGGASLVSFGISGATGISGVYEYRRLENQCSPRCATSELDGVRGRFLAADIALAVGIAALGGAVLAFILNARSP